MKACKMFLGILSLCTVVTASLGAQSAAQSGSAASEARAKELQSRYMTAVKTTLTSKLDTKSAVAGQPLTLKTDAAVTLADGTVIPAGTTLVGRVIGVRAKTDEQAGSMVVVTFDKAELKDGKTIAVRSMIKTVSGMKAAAPPQSGGDMMAPGIQNTDPMTGGTINPQTQSGNGGRGRGTVGGGGMGAGGGGTGIGRMPQGTTSPTTIGSVTGANAGDTVQMTAPGGESVSNAPRPTGLPGVMLSTNPSTDVSGTLMGYGQNIRLENGTQITLGVILR